MQADRHGADSVEQDAVGQREQVQARLAQALSCSMRGWLMAGKR